MSTSSLPAYTARQGIQSPSYSAEPRYHEQRLALSRRIPAARPSGEFVKESKSRGIRLRLFAQREGVELPIYASGTSIVGTIELSKTEGVTSVEVKIEGRLRVHEIGAGGTTSVKLCQETVLLWVRDATSNSPCPSTVPFRLSLPSTFVHEDNVYPLPPTYDVALEGIPGFTATIEYSITASIIKPTPISISLFGKSLADVDLATTFIYYPRTNPIASIPSLLHISRNGYIPTHEWQLHESVIHGKSSNTSDIHSKLYLPSSRMFCMSQMIPFHLIFSSSVYSLASFLPYAPSANPNSRRATQVQVMRQTAVDARHAMISTTKTGMWRVDDIGVTSFTLAGDAPTWVAFDGEIRISSSVKTTGFKAGGLRVKDCLIFTFSPPDQTKCPFAPLRQVIPIALTTEVFTAGGAGIGGAQRPIQYPTDYGDVEMDGDLYAMR